MDHYSILDPGPARIQPEPAVQPEPTRAAMAEPMPAEPLRFPGDDGGKSLAEMAERDLDATLQLLADRAQYITGASGAAIALREDNEMICRASAGPSAPEMGAELQVNSGLTGESVRSRQILRCDNAETDGRVNRESCRGLGIASVVVMPLIRDEEVTGVFELLSGRAYAFEERDITALQRLGEMILTALEHADAAKRAQKEIAAQIPVAEIAAETKPETEGVIAGSAIPAGEQTPEEGAVKPVPATVALEPPEGAVPVNAVPIKIKKCESCGFPVSEGRSICLDCEAARESSGQPQATAEPAFLSQLAEPSWFAAHKFLIAMLAVTAITLAVVLWLR